MRRTEPLPFGDLIHSWIKAARLEGKLREIRIRNAWHEAMGKAISKQTGEVYLKDNVLIVHLRSAILRNELQMRRQKILALLKEKLGDEAPGGIVLR